MVSFLIGLFAANYHHTFEEAELERVEEELLREGALTSVKVGHLCVDFFDLSLWHIELREQ